MIDRLDIGNLKSFGTRRQHGSAVTEDRPHEIRLAPLTLVFGPNSAGKSTIIQALSVLRDALQRDAQIIDGPRDLTLRGDFADLGNFRAAVHRHDINRSIYLGARLRRPGQRPFYAGLSFCYDELREDGVQDCAVLGDGDHLLRFRPTEGYEMALDGEAASSLPEVVFRPQTESQITDEQLDLPGLSRALSARLANGAQLHFLQRGFFPALPERDILADPAIDRAFATWFEQAMHSRVRSLRNYLGAMTYLGPLRVPPSRLQAFPTAETSDVGASGEHTARLLLRAPQLVTDVNGWLPRLGIQYLMSVDQVHVEDRLSGLRGHDVIGKVEIGKVVTTTLIDPRNRVAVSPQDVGFGVSQLFPIVVQCLVNRNRIICVEQPEVHIHPRVQAEVADLLIESAAERGNQVIVETHSEHLMLRVQRRIREARRRAEGLHQPGDDPSGGWLSSDKVSVVYVDSDSDGHARPIQLELDESGHFETPWPDGFFADRIKELYGGGGRPPLRIAPSIDDDYEAEG